MTQFKCSLHRYASSIDDILEDEEHYADQLKEYLFYAEALRWVSNDRPADVGGSCFLNGFFVSDPVVRPQCSHTLANLCLLFSSTLLHRFSSTLPTS